MRAHALDRQINSCLPTRYKQARPARLHVQKSTKFFWRSSHESALSLHRHARPGPTLSDRNWLAQKLRYFSPALETIRMSVLLRWTTLLGCLLFRLHRVHFTRTG